MDLGGEDTRGVHGGNRYPMKVRDDFSCQACMYFVSHKHNAASAFEKFLHNLRVEGISSEIVIVRSDDGGDFMEEKVEKDCRESKRK